MNNLKGYAAVIGSAVVFGFSTVIAKHAMNMGMDPFSFSVTSMFFVALFMVPYYLTLKAPKLTKRDWRDFVVLGVFASCVAHLAYTFGLAWTSAINFSFLSQTTVLFTILFAFFLLGERLKKWQAIAGVVMLAGVFLVTTGGKELAFQTGDLILIGGSMILGATNVFAKKLMDRHRPGAVAFWRSVFGFVGLLAVALLLGVDVLSTVGLYSAVNGLLIALIFVLIYVSLNELGASLAALLFLIAPVFSVALAMVVLGEPLLPVQLVGGTLIIAGAFLTYKS